MTRPSGTRETHSGRKGWLQKSNGKPNNWATNLSPSNPKLHNDPIQHTGVPWKVLGGWLRGALPAELLLADDVRPLANDHQLVGGYLGKIFYGSVGPANGQVGRGFRTQPEVKATVVGRIETRLGCDLLRLAAAAVLSDHTGADGTAITLHADQLDLEPVMIAGDIIA